MCTSGNIPLCQSLADPISQHLQAVKHGLALLFFVQAFLCPRARCTPTYARTATHNPTCTTCACAATTTTTDSQLPCQPLRQRDELNQEKVETGRVEERRVRVRGGVCRDGRVEGHAGWAGLEKKMGQQCSLLGRGVGGYGVRVRVGSWWEWDWRREVRVSYRFWVGGVPKSSGWWFSGWCFKAMSSHGEA